MIHIYEEKMPHKNTMTYSDPTCPVAVMSVEVHLVDIQRM